MYAGVCIFDSSFMMYSMLILIFQHYNGKGLCWDLLKQMTNSYAWFIVSPLLLLPLSTTELSYWPTLITITQISIIDCGSLLMLNSRRSLIFSENFIVFNVTEHGYIIPCSTWQNTIFHDKQKTYSTVPQWWRYWPPLSPTTFQIMY